MRNSLVAVLLIGFVPLALANPSASAEVPASVYLHPQKLVRVGSRLRLNLFCEGSGSPTVVLEAGRGADMLTWRRVQGRLARFTRTCAYDRAGYGFSDPATRPSDATDAVANLQRLIHAAPIATPIVLVGHSIGGQYATLFAATHTKEVAGMVLVDPAFADEDRLLSASLPTAKRNIFVSSAHAMIKQEKVCLHAAMLRQQGKPSKFPDDCLDDDPPNPNPALHRELDHQDMRVSTNLALLSELTESTPRTLDQQSVDSKELEAARLNLGDMPLIVLTAAHESTPGLSRSEHAKFDTAWLTGHEALARASIRGLSIVVRKSGHSIQIDRPLAVINAVHKVVEAARAVKAHAATRSTTHGSNASS